MTYKVRKPFIIAFVVAVWLAVFGSSYKVEGQATLVQPRVYAVSSTKVGWTAGTLNNGGHAVTVTASSASVTLSMTDCSSPSFAACNFVVSDSSGTVTVTTSVTGATASGVTLMAYVETNGSAITKLSFPNQANISTTPNRTHLDCGTQVNCSTPGPTAKISAVRTFGGTVSVSSSSGATIIYGLSPAFTSTSTYGCSAVVTGNTATTTVATYARTSASAVSFFIKPSQGTGTENVGWFCTGY